MKFLIRSFFKLVRLVVGPIMLFLDYVTSPKGVKRPQAEQDEIDRETRSLRLYHFRTCPFCIKVRREIKRLSLDIEFRDAQFNVGNREALLLGGGMVKVPCLRIEHDNGNVQWLYESDDINAYLRKHFPA